MKTTEQKIEERHEIISNLKGYMAGWLARHDPEELERRQRMMGDYEVTSEDEDWTVNGN